MQSSDDQNDQLLEALNAFVDGSISIEQFAALQELIKQDPEARRLCADYLQLSAGLYFHAEQTISAFDPGDELTLPKAAGSTSQTGDSLPLAAVKHNALGQMLQSLSSRRWLSAAATIMLLATASVASWQWRVKSDRPAVAAAWTNGFGVQWSSSDLRLVGSALDAKKYHLLQGVAEVTFESGTVLIVEAPAQFSIVSPESISVEHGQLVARVPGTAESFTIRSAATEFFEPTGELGIRVSSGGLAEVHVFHGEASVRPKLPRSSGAVVTQLTAGDSRRIDASGAMQDLRADEVQASAFVRRVGAVVQTDPELAPPQIADDFNDGKSGWLTGYPYAAAEPFSLVEEKGQLAGRIEPGVKDPFFHLPVATRAINSMNFPFVRFRLTVQGAEAYRSNQLFYRPDGEPDVESRSLEFFSGRKEVEEFHARLPFTSAPIEILRLDPVQNTPKTSLTFAYDYIYFDRHETIGLAEFDSAGDAQDWQGVDLVKSRVADGCFQGQLYGFDAALRTADVQVDADHFDHLELRLKLQDHDGPIALYWGKWGDNLSEDKQALIQPVLDGKFHRYLIDLRRASGWKGSIRLLQLDFGDSAGTKFELDYVRALHLQDEPKSDDPPEDSMKLDQAI